MKESTKNILIALMNSVKQPILNWLEKEAVKKAIALLIKKPFMADFRIWLIKFAVDHLIDDIAKPLINYFFQKVGYEYEVLDGKHLLKKIASAGNVGEWDNATDSV